VEETLYVLMELPIMWWARLHPFSRRESDIGSDRAGIGPAPHEQRMINGNVWEKIHGGAKFIWSCKFYCCRGRRHEATERICTKDPPSRCTHCWKRLWADHYMSADS
jgi:hypothetical protein